MGFFDIKSISRQTDFSGRRKFLQAGQWSGGLRVVVPPGPISNPEVKRDIADGSASIGHARVGRCQS